MAYVQEIEMFSCLTENFRLAAEAAEALAVLPKRGPTYKKLMDQLKLCEGACRQVARERGDARWLQIGLAMDQAHQRAGTWLRKYIGGKDRQIAHRLFLLLGENLRFGQAEAEKMRHAATGKLGLILPKPLPSPHRETRPVQVVRPSGLIVPASMG
jgi:hypothetical protein